MSQGIATENYEFIRQLVYHHSRINLGPDKMGLVRSRVQKRLRALGLADFDSYCRLLDCPSGKEELTALVDVISTNVTQFFREMEHFEFLQNTFLPGYCAARKPSSREPLRVWSAACSSGQEPYSLAILLADFFRREPERPWQIVATDISTRMLEIGRQAIYPGNQIQLPAKDWLSAYFQKGAGSWEGHYRIKSCLRQRVQFRHLNLLQWPYPWREKFDVIFCRNVMIYFDRQTQEQLVSCLSGQLEAAGHLFVGHSESLIGIEHGLKRLRPSIYQKSNAMSRLLPITR
jgi:chemotaxis protein methyltransferase CheR